MAQRQNRAAQLRGNLIEVPAAMTAAHVASVGNIAGNQIQGLRILAQNPLDPEISNGVFEGMNWKFEFTLLDGNGNEFVWEWRPFLICDEGMEQRQAVLASGNANGNAVATLQHGESPHGAADQIQNLLFDIHDGKTIAEK
jgi:hypothetical protein